MSITHIGKMAVAAHRGDSYNCYENTMEAFEAAVLARADMIELDVHLTLDNELIIMHDDTVDRTSDGKGKISSFTLAEILKLNVGDANNVMRVPVFEQFMAWAQDKDIMLNIEIKEYYSKENEKRCALCIDKTLELVDRYGFTERCVINSFDAWVLEYVFKKHGKKYMLHGFYPYSIMGNVSINPDTYLYCACIFDIKNKALYDELLKKGIEPWIGASVTQEKLLSLCCSYGARLVTTNNPTDAISKLKRLNKRYEK